MKNVLLAMACALLAGCAALECDTEWYETGRIDGRLGAESQLEYHIARCGENAVDRERYLRGWRDGVDMRPRISVP